MFNKLLRRFYDPFSQDLKRLNTQLDRTLTATRLSSLRHVNDYVLSAPGKRLRPLFHLLCYRHGSDGDGMYLDQTFEFAQSLELIHMASLIHDDIIDEAAERHNVPTIHKKYGIGVAIPLGVDYYARALQLLCRVNNVELIRLMSHAVKQLCEGELDQVFERFNLSWSIQAYLIMVRKKTAALFEVAGMAGGTLARCPSAECHIYKSIGYCFGMMFQISDDILDLTDSEGQLQKSLGQDLFQGDITLPVLLFASMIDDSEKRDLLKRMKQKDATVIELIRREITKPEIKTRLRDLFDYYSNRLAVHLSTLKPNKMTPYFELVAQIIESRIKEIK